MMDNIELRDELAALMGWKVIGRDTDGTYLWAQEGRPMQDFHPVRNYLDCASGAIRAAGWSWERVNGLWIAMDVSCSNANLKVLDTRAETYDLLMLAVEVWKCKAKEQP